MLRQFTAEDIGDLFLLFGDPDVMHYGDGPHSEHWVEKWLHIQLAKSDSLDRICPYAVNDRNSGRFIGYCGLFTFGDIHGRKEIELGYRLLKREWNRGYGKEAASAMLRVAFHEWQMPRLISLIDPGNIASIKIALALGMRKESEVMLPGYDHPDHVYSIENMHCTQQGAQPDAFGAG